MKPVIDTFAHELAAASAKMQAEFFRQGTLIMERKAKHYQTLARRGRRAKCKSGDANLAAEPPGQYAGK